MINLIPNTEKRAMINEFYYRLAATVFIVLGLVMILAAAAILPSYFLSSSKKSQLEQNLAVQKMIPLDQADQDTVAALADLDAKLAFVESFEKNKFSVSRQVVDAVVKRKNAGIKISHISFERGAENSLSVRGTARSREELLVFRRTLEENPMFKKVDLPISNFVRGTNIQFQLTLVVS